LAVVSACGRTVHQTEGDLLAVDAGAATIAHEAIPGVMEAATTRFEARPPAILDAIRPGARVRLELVREGDTLVLVTLQPIGAAPAAFLHDHAPRHGGVVREVDDVVIEIAASRDGRVRVWLSDGDRRPLPVRDATGTVRVHVPDGVRTLSLAAAGDVLDARTAPFDGGSAVAEVAIAFRGTPLDVTVLLDLTGERAGLPILPRTSCVTVEPTPAGTRAPRCAVTFGGTFTAIATTPDGTRAVVAVSHGPTSVWSLPDATVIMGIDPLPPVASTSGAHAPDPRVVAVRPDGHEIAVAAGPRLVFYDAATGRLRRKIEGPGGTIHAVAWSSDGRSILIATSGDDTARLLDAAHGRVVRTIPAAGPVRTIALDASGRRAAVGTEVGTLLVADLGADGPPRVLTPSLQPIAAVAFATADHLLVAGADGTLRVVDPATGGETARVDVGAPLRLLAVAPDGRHAATADAASVLRLHRLPGGAVVERLAWHRATVGVLAWGAGPTLVSGDNDAALAVWDLPAAR
jgi:WD40 repeat protein/Cu/Ag efflux protein CusF